MPIAGEEFIFEMTVNALLHPSSGGIPTWNPTMIGERMMTKLPAQFKSVFAKPIPLSEEIGRMLADWAEGTKSVEFDGMARRIADAGSIADLEQLVAQLTALKEKKTIPPNEFKALREAYGDRLKTLEEYARANPDEEEQDEPEVDPETGEVIPPPLAQQEEAAP